MCEILYASVCVGVLWTADGNFYQICPMCLNNIVGCYDTY